jgi:dUTP pyrophosphatase
MQSIPTEGPVVTELIRFKTTDERARMPAYETAGAAGFDLSVIEDISVGLNKTVMARTGLVIGAPAGCMLMLAPRSSTWKKWGVRLGNTVGIVDEDYCGDEDELLLALWNPGPMGPKRIPAGTRVAQGIFVPILSGRSVAFSEQQSMGGSRGGWGSTGQ